MAETNSGDPRDGTYQGGRNGGSRPVPDPTVLTTELVDRAIAAERERTEAQLDVLRERLQGIDRATELRLMGIVEIPKTIDEKVGNLANLTDERFRSIATQFLERDTRSERESRDNKVAVDAAFAAQKEAAAKQDESNAKSIEKSENKTAETIRSNADLSKTEIGALRDQVGDMKERVSRLETAQQTRTEQSVERKSSSGLTAVWAGFAVAFIMAIITVVVLVVSKGP
jgi:DNA-binding transcriptional regulator YiaG